MEAFSLLEIRTHLQMLQTSAAGAKSQACFAPQLSASAAASQRHDSAYNDQGSLADPAPDAWYCSLSVVLFGSPSSSHDLLARVVCLQAGRSMFEFADDSVCKACGVARLTFEPPSLYCTACGQRIKRNQVRCTAIWLLSFRFQLLPLPRRLHVSKPPLHVLPQSQS